MSLLPPSLIDLLSNALIFDLIIPHIPIPSLLALSSASRPFHNLLKSSPNTFRRLDFTTLALAKLEGGIPLDVGGISWRSQRMDEALTEEEFYSGPLLGIFYQLEKQYILKNASTLILDGIAVTVDIFSDIILDTSGKYNVKILSVRGVRKLMEHKRSDLARIIRDAVKPGRPKGFPKLQALYIFGPPENTYQFPEQREQREELLQYLPQLVADAPLEKWYLPSGKMYHQPLVPWTAIQDKWIQVLEAAEGKIQVDGILCRGPDHEHLPGLANIGLGFGCMGCGTSPEGPAIYGKSPAHWLPLLSPPPFNSSAREASRPTPLRDGSYPPLFARCIMCVNSRRCVKCRQWVCENCASGEERLRWIVRYIDIVDGRVPKSAFPDTGILAIEPDQVDEAWRALDINRWTPLCLRKCMQEEYRRKWE
ncbi:hypothetical protein H072_1597 [Dactylellina haptotyla CBS 200.50]|uniref:F-box domain-containing protein n=1 Tax=Dactylellina haptotyla (strain CBS 200.50) TaxID=1284197 RepID=S8BY40_DACHA|nr:hypothetical protein H072_1597 [Dactylellina haptotyla CBS 200.50]